MCICKSFLKKLSIEITDIVLIHRVDEEVEATIKQDDQNWYFNDRIFREAVDRPVKVRICKQ